MEIKANRSSRPPNVLISIDGPRNSIWVLAAMTLPYGDREKAYQDIASMTGWTFSTIRIAARALKRAGGGDVAVSAPVLPSKPSCLPASSLRQPTKEQLMSGRAC